MKQGWEIKKLGEVCEQITDGSHFSPKSSDESEYPYITVRDIDNDVIDFDSCKFINKKDYQLLLKNGCKPNFGDLLFSKDGTVGKVSLVDFEKDFVVLSSLAIIRPKSKIILSSLLKYILKDPSFLETAIGLKTGVAIRRIILKNLKQIEITFPKSLPEQQRIVSILDEAFAAIEKAKANAEQNLKNAKALFESYLQEVFENGKWEKKSIEKVCNEIFAGGDAPKNNFSLELNEKHQIPIYANAVKDRGLYGFTDFARVIKPCVTIAARGSGTGHTELRNEPFFPIVRLIVCIPNVFQISTEFLKYAIDNLVIQRSGSAIPQLTVPMIKEYQIPLPSIAEQKQIIENAETLRAETQKLEAIYQKKLTDLEELKKSILQKAFAGELG